MNQNIPAIKKPLTRIDSRPVISLFVSAVLWGTVWYPYRVIESVIPSSLAMLIANVIALVVIHILFPHGPSEIKKHPLSLVMLAIGVGLGNLAYIQGTLHGNTIRVLLLFYLSPLWSVPLARLVLSETISRTEYIALIIGCMGAGLILWNPSVGLPLLSNSAEWLGILAGFSFTFANVMVRRVADCHIGGRAWYAFLGTVVASGIAVLINFQSMPMLATLINGASQLLLIAVWSIAMSLFVQYGLSHLPAVQANTILLFELVVAMIAANLLTNDTPQTLEIIGGGLIFMACALIAIRR